MQEGPSALDVVEREARLLHNRLRSTRRALRALDRQLTARTLSVFTLRPGEQIDGEVLDFLRLAVSQHPQQEVVVTIQVREHQDQGASNGR